MVARVRHHQNIEATNPLSAALNFLILICRINPGLRVRRVCRASSRPPVADVPTRAVGARSPRLQ